MKKTLKRALGFVLLAQVLPLAFVLASLSDINHKDYSAWIPFMAGYGVDLFIALAGGFVWLIGWCFDCWDNRVYRYKSDCPQK